MVKSFNTVNAARGLENYREHFHHRYPKNQKRHCGHIVVEPMFVRAHEDHSPLKNERAYDADLKQILNLLLQPSHTRAVK
jgi:hypothetical protein